MNDILLILSPLLLIPLIWIKEIKLHFKQKRCVHKSYSITGTSSFMFVLWNVHSCDECGKEYMTMKSKYDQ